jgi:hypothetical protein
MAGLYDFLDTLGSAAADLAGRAVDGISAVKVAQANAATPARVPDASSAPPVSTLSSNLGLTNVSPMVLVGVGLALVLGVFLLARSRG